MHHLRKIQMCDIWNIFCVLRNTENQFIVASLHEMLSSAMGFSEFFSKLFCTGIVNIVLDNL